MATKARKVLAQKLHEAATVIDSDEDELATTEALKLCEGCGFTESVQIREAKADYEIKLIAPGKGSTAFYTEEALKASGPKVFKAGTHMYWNHPSRSEESERPERDLNTLAAVLTSAAVYKENHAKGPGLYASAKVFSDYAEQVESKAPHIGLSIMASGLAVTENGKPVMREGVPVLKEFTHAESTDFVTRAGAGGMVLTEEAIPPTNEKEAAMDAAELKLLQESNTAMKAQLQKLRERAVLSDAAGAIRGILATLRLSEAIAQRLTGRILAGAIPVTEGGDLDLVKLQTLVEQEAKEECSYIASLTGGRMVTGMGAPAAVLSEGEKAQAQKDLEAEAKGFAAGLGLRTEEAQDIMTRGRSAFRADFNAGEK